MQLSKVCCSFKFFAHFRVGGGSCLFGVDSLIEDTTSYILRNLRAVITASKVIQGGALNAVATGRISCGLFHGTSWFGGSIFYFLFGTRVRRSTSNEIQEFIYWRKVGQAILRWYKYDSDIYNKFWTIDRKNKKRVNLKQTILDRDRRDGSVLN